MTSPLPVSAPRSGRRSGKGEAAVVSAVLEYLAMHPAVHRAWRVNSGAMVAEGPAGRRFFRFNGAEGHSDIAGVLKGGRAVFIECKTPSGRLTEKQRTFLADMEAGGALTGVARNTDDVAALMEMAA